MLPQKQVQELIRGMQLIMRIRCGKNRKTIKERRRETC